MMDETNSMITVQLNRDGCDPIEVLASQLTPRSVATLFGVSQASFNDCDLGTLNFSLHIYTVGCWISILKRGWG